MALDCKLSSEGQQRRINTKKGPLVHQKQLRKTNWDRLYTIGRVDLGRLDIGD
jgi:hypothetical protein